MKNINSGLRKTTEYSKNQVTVWSFPHDLNRLFIVPHNYELMIKAPFKFKVSLPLFSETEYSSVPAQDGTYHSIIAAGIKSIQSSTRAPIEITLLEKNEKYKPEVIFLAKDFQNIKMTLYKDDIKANPNIFLAGNGCGAMIRTNIKWGEINSRYDAILAANFDNDVPIDKTVMLTRYRAWIIINRKITELTYMMIDSFHLDSKGKGIWDFKVPIEEEQYIKLNFSMSMIQGKNSTILSIRADYPDSINQKSIRLRLRPDVDNRSIHENTFLNNSLKSLWEKAIKTVNNGFEFRPQFDRKLKISTNKGRFEKDYEFLYDIYHITEHERGMGDSGDIFSPGYFDIDLSSGEDATLTALALSTNSLLHNGDQLQPNDNVTSPEAYSYQIESITRKSIRDFIVKRDSQKTILAGYPWFLDWGRDTLICARGMIAAEMYNEVEKILMQFAYFQNYGTMPNNLNGNTVGSRDTSDAPLWFIVVCKEYIEATGDQSFLIKDVHNGKTVLETLIEIAISYLNGTQNGIKVDPDTLLVYSPSHFTWMDTSNPAGTPRQGYPVEIQALWFAALNYLSLIDSSLNWNDLSKKLKKSFSKYYLIKELDESGDQTGRIYLSDCLHCLSPDDPANMLKDDHIRPNQLFAISLGLVNNDNLAKSILNICSDYLLIPGALRSLANRDNKFKIPIYGMSGNLINNPSNPYRAKYDGEEDTSRKAAYHNGTGWTWLLPTYCEAYYKQYGKAGLPYARSILSSSQLLFETGCIGHLPEIIDGDYPHKQRGCDAQAWSVTELYRVWKLLHHI